MFETMQEVIISENYPLYPQYNGCIGVITGVYPANNTGDQRTLYDVQIADADTVLYLYENEITPLYPVMGLH